MKGTSCLKEFIKYASLNVMGMIGLSCYILADTYFISKGLGANGLAALNLAIPVYSFISGCGLMLGMGGATKYSILKSQNETENANIVFTNTMLLTIVSAFLFVAVSLFFSQTIATAFGAEGVVFQMSKTYLRMILLFAPVFMMNNVLLCYVRNDGAPQLSMIAMVVGSLSNIVLDYLFIFPMGMGIFGAVLATGIAPVISMLILSQFFIKKRNHFHLTKYRVSRRLMGSIFSGGLPSLISEVSSGIVIIAFNAIILRLQGNVGVAAYGVIANLSLVVIAIYTGIAQGIQPLISSYYGSGDSNRIQAVLRYALVSVLILSAAIYSGIFFGALPIVDIFNSEQNLQLEAIAVIGLKIYFTGCVFAGINIVLSVYFTSTEFAVPAHIISVLRGLIIILPLAFLLSAVGGMIGVWCVFPLTELIVSGIGLALYCFVRSDQKETRKKDGI